jgi:hypothetical protein
MAESEILEQNPKVVALIGAYDILDSNDEPYIEETWLGEEGALGPESEEPVLWREARRLRVSIVDLDDQGVYRSLEVQTGPSALAPEARVRILSVCLGEPGRLFNERAKLVSHRLRRYYTEHGVPNENWPKIDLAPRDPEPVPIAQAADLARESMASFEKICLHGNDPVLGRYVDLTPDLGSMGRLFAVGVGSLAFALTAPQLWPSNRILFVSFISAAFGLWWLLRWTSIVIRSRRLRVGENGLAILPGDQFIRWSDVDLAYLSPKYVGWQLTVRMSDPPKPPDLDWEDWSGADRRRWTLAPLRTPGHFGIRREDLRIAEASLLLSRELEAVQAWEAPKVKAPRVAQEKADESTGPAGKYVEFGFDLKVLKRQVKRPLAIAGLLIQILVVTVLVGLLVDPAAFLVALVVSVALLVAAVIAFGILRLGRTRLRVGEYGIEIAPGGKFVPWRAVTEFKLRRGIFGLSSLTIRLDRAIAMSPEPTSPLIRVALAISPGSSRRLADLLRSRLPGSHVTGPNPK